MKRVLVTGATGFVGAAVLDLALTKQHDVLATVRNESNAIGCNVSKTVVTDLNADTHWGEALESRDVVVHSAARVHVMEDQSTAPLDEFRKVNVDGTVNLARQAAAAGVKRFIFISSIKVNGEGTLPGQPYTAFDTPAPQDPYGVSKMEAEQGLRQIADETAMQVVIIRPVLVYGPGVKANFRSMMNWVNKGVPLPLGAINNSRSLVGLDNLVDLIVTCIDHPAAANQTFLVSDGEDLSTTQMLKRMALALGKTARLLPIPVALLKGGAALLGKPTIAQRLCGSLQVDISHTRKTLNWTPPVSVDSGFLAAATAFLNE